MHVVMERYEQPLAKHSTAPKPFRMGSTLNYTLTTSIVLFLGKPVRRFNHGALVRCLCAMSAEP